MSAHDSVPRSPSPEPGVAPNRSRWRSVVLWLVLLVAPIVVFHPIVFGGFTFAQSPFTAETSTTYGASDTLPVLDPSAAASQDESWLVLIRRDFARGRVPLVNMQNGLGASFLESLQPGVLYPPNLLLLLFDEHSSWLFDVFVLVHVQILLAGLFVLFRRYAREPIALVVALTIGLSGVTYQHLDMVHYRSFVWMPWALAASVSIARGEARRKYAIVFVVAHATAISAGALQEAFLSSLAIGVVFAIELAASERSAVVSRARRTMTMLALVCASTCLASPAVLPYLAARARGDLYTQATIDRSTTGLDGDAFLSFLLPHVHGLYPHLLRAGRSIRVLSDFATCGAFFLFVAFAAVALRRTARAGLVFTLVAIATTLVALKVQHVAALDFVSKLPFLNEILYSKYHLLLFVLVGILAAIGLEEFARGAPIERRRILARATAAFVIVLGLSWLYIATSDQWLAINTLPEVTRIELWTSHSASIAAFVACAVVLWAVPRGASWILAAVVIAQATLVAPHGWYARRAEFWTPPGLEHLDANVRGERVLTTLAPNQNLRLDFESISVFDPVNLRSLHRFMTRNFLLDNNGFILHPTSTESGLRDRDLDAARFLGVTRIHGHALATTNGVREIEPGLYALEGSLPRVFALPRESFAELDVALNASPPGPVVKSILAANARAPAVENIEIGAGRVSFALDRDFSGFVVVSQAFSSGWSRDGHDAQPFARTLCAWDVAVHAHERIEVVNRPRGLRIALPLAAFGLVVALATIVFAYRPTAATRAQPE